jgi:hypothetical protein
MSEAPGFEDYLSDSMNSEELLEIGQALLKAAFSPPYGNTPMGAYLLDEAFMLGKRSLEAGNLDIAELD